MPVTFHRHEADTSLLNGKKRKISEWVCKIIDLEKRIPGNISIIYTSKAKLLKMNNTFLKHNYHTDIITFDYNRGNVLNGDLFIGIDQVLDNAKNYNVPAEKELQRVIIHGILHLLGYPDKTNEQKQKMCEKEDWALEILNKL